METVSFEDAIAYTGHGRFHYLLLLGCGFCHISLMVSTLSTSYLLPSAACDFDMTPENKGLLSAICYVGMICSSHMWGYLADTRGRKKVLIIGLLGDAVCSIVSSLSPVFWLYLIFRFLNGFFICSCSSVVYAYLGEFHATSTRTQAIMSVGLFISLGSVMLAGLAWVIIIQPWSLDFPTYIFHSWRVFVIFSGFPGLLTALLLATCLPESPKFLLAQGKQRETLNILRRIYSTNTRRSPETYSVKSVLLESHIESTCSKYSKENKSFMLILRDIWRQTVPLFIRPHLKNTLLACSIQFVFYSTSLSFAQWLPHIFNNLAAYTIVYPGGPSNNICEAIGPNAVNITTSVLNTTNLDSLSPVNDIENNITVFLDSKCEVKVNTEMFVNSMIHGSVSGLFYFLAGHLVHFVGKKTLLFFEIILATACGIGLYFVLTSAGVLTLACIFTALIYSCIGVMNSVVVDIFPTNLRAMAVCLPLMVGRIGVMVGSVLLGVLLNDNCDVTFFVLSAVVLASGILTFFLPTPKKLNI